MSDKNTFARLMGQIGAEAEQQQLAELRAMQRQAKMRSIRKICLTVIGVSTVGWAYANRAEIGHRLSQAISPPAVESRDLTSEEAISGETTSVQAPPKSPHQNTGSNLKFIQAQAHQRDQALLELSK